MNAICPTELMASVRRVVEPLHRSAQQRWPEFQIPIVEFASFLLSRQPLSAATTTFEYATDLYLACACLKGSGAAIRVLEHEYVLPILTSWPGLEDVRQAVLERLLASPKYSRAKLAEYSGRSSLRTWLRVVCRRVQCNLSRTQSHSIMNELSDQVLLPVGSDPELEYMRVRYACEFKQAFYAALRSLGDKRCQLLRMHLLEKASGEAIAASFGVSRVTVVRWLGEIHHRLLFETQRRLQSENGVSTAEFASVMRIVREDLDLSLSVLAEEGVCS